MLELVEKRRCKNLEDQVKEVEKKIVEEEVEVKVEDLQSQVVMKENSSHIETNLT